MNKLFSLIVFLISFSLCPASFGQSASLIAATNIIKNNPSLDETGDGRSVIAYIHDSTGAGANNSSGIGTCSAGVGYFYRHSDGTIQDISNDVVSAPDGTQYPAMCAAYNTATSKKLVIVPMGFASPSLNGRGSEFSPNGDTYNWSTSGVLYDPGITDVDAALHILGLAKPKAIFISLGINDERASTTLSTVQSDINSLISRLQSKWSGVPIIIEQIGRDESALFTTRMATIRKYIRSAAVGNTNVHIVDGMLSLHANGYYGADNLHPTQAGNTVRGQRLARWLYNDTYTKWARSIISSHYDDLSTARKNLIQTFITNAGTEYLLLDQLLILKNTIKQNTLIDFVYLAAPQDAGFTFTANTSISGNSTSTVYKPSSVPNSSWTNGSQNDFFYVVKVKTNNTPSGSAGVLSASYDGTNRIRIAQVNTNTLQVSANSNTNINDNTDTKFQNGALYGTARNGTTQYFLKNTTIVTSSTIASTGFTSRAPVLFCDDSNGSLINPINAELEYLMSGVYTSINFSTLYTQIEALINGW